MGMNQSILQQQQQQQLCVSTKKHPGPGSKNPGGMAPRRTGVSGKGGHKQLTPFPNGQAGADPKPWCKCRLEPGEASSIPTQSRGLELSVSPGTPSPLGFSLVRVVFNPGREVGFHLDQTPAPSEHRDLTFAGTEPRSWLGNPEVLLPVLTCPEVRTAALKNK